MYKKFLGITFTVIFLMFSTFYSNAFSIKMVDKVHFLNTKGYGDATIIESNGKFALIDCGEDISFNATYIAQYLEDLGADKVDYFIMSHAHSDHIGAFSELSKLIKIDKFVGMDLGIDSNTDLEDKENHPFYDKENEEWKVGLIEVEDCDYNNDGVIDKNWKTDYYYQQLLIGLEKQGIYKGDKSKFIVPEENDTIRLGDYILQFNNTFKNLEDIESIKKDFNSSSTWITLTKGNSKIALTGDINKTQGDKVVNNYLETNDVDLYKIAHHSLNNTSDNMIEKLNPKISIAMGMDKITETTKKLHTYGSDVYYTTKNGAISLTLKNNEISLDKDYKKVDVVLNNEWTQIGDEWYYYENNKKVADCWKQILGYWYYFKPNGTCAIDEFYEVEGIVYRFDKRGQMLSNTFYKDFNGNSYWLTSSGRMSSNEWLKIDENWYRFDKNGIMLENTWFEDQSGYNYWLESNGKMASDKWLRIDNHWYRFYKSGAMIKSNWYQDPYQTWYWLDAKGQMASEKFEKINNKTYRFTKSGAMLNNSWYQVEDGTWYWLKPGGAMALGEWVYNGKAWYKFDYNGCMLSNKWYSENDRWYWLKSSGAMANNEWVEVDHDWYRFNENGSMLRENWYQDLNAKWYYLKNSGVMVKNTKYLISGRFYSFDSSGAWKG